MDRKHITEETHPFKHDIIGLNIEGLHYRKGIVEMAVRAWGGDEFKDRSQDDIEYNINYFKTELNIINKEIQKHK